MYSIDKTLYFFWISKFLEATWGTQLITIFLPPGINSWFLQVPLKVLQFENHDSRNGNVFLNNKLWVSKEYLDTSNFTVCNSNNCLGVRICSEKGLCEQARAANLLEVLPIPSQAGKPENQCRNSFLLKNRTVKDQHS